jgi:hypothetical protein
VKAGDEFGRQRDNPLDFNTFDATTWLKGFANPFSYADGEAWKPYFSDPAAVFSPDVWKTFDNSMQRTQSPRYGVIDHDIVGSAAGGWFLDGTIGYNGLPIDTVTAATSALGGGQVPGKNFYSWNHLAIAPEQVDPSVWMFSTGSWSDPKGDAKQFAIDLAGAPAPDQLTAANGAVVYRLSQLQVTQPAGFSKADGGKAPDGIGYTVKAGDATQGWVVLQVVDATHLAVEVVPGDQKPAGFGAGKVTYHR